jgi:hypothetical protein
MLLGTAQLFRCQYWSGNILSTNNSPQGFLGVDQSYWRSIAGYCPMEWPSVALVLLTCNGQFSLALIIKAVIEKGPQGSLTRQFPAENGEGHFAAAGAAAIQHSSCIAIEGTIFQNYNSKPNNISFSFSVGKLS